ncbi:catechol 2,3-dioxygenase-like lactoylglutathione lyase family enzyme [Pseudomonas duriflava]|uniref:Catechol 2,3-dioxygenase-like lactoylglutathione lyase family enzyme n=1 Tax=Pseudomonas duriflava TaxID=459528 RepID=A0A562Q8Z6_9PSED|nr:VOC family protein [Pseudomonas duriflava]TWI53188.1 catechol 2,3-dioxygenase-like lactoylglutathione lyase family enzyme [Pseudomonas duriflava]
MNNSPIENKIGCVFIPVSDMRQAVEWYSRLLGQPVETISHEGQIYDLPMRGALGVILDSHKPVINSSQPICFFWIDELHQTRSFLAENNVEIVREIEDVRSVLTLTLRDPDGNLLTVCQRK